MNDTFLWMSVFFTDLAIIFILIGQRRDGPSSGNIDIHISPYAAGFIGLASSVVLNLIVSPIHISSSPFAFFLVVPQLLTYLVPYFALQSLGLPFTINLAITMPIIFCYCFSGFQFFNFYKSISFDKEVREA